jgi:MFS family permease
VHVDERHDLGRLLALRPRAPAPDVDDELEYTETHLPLVVISSIGMLAVRAAVGFFIFTLAFTLRRTSEPAYIYGIAAALYGAGAFAGHSAAAVLRRRFREERLISLAIALPAAFTAVGVLGASVPLLMVISLLVGLSTTLARNAFDGLLQRRAPEALLGRAGARYETQFQLAWVFGGVIATPISLPAEVSMMLLTAIYVPAFVICMRGVSEADRFSAHDHGMIRAQERLSEAHGWWADGDRRVAILEASAAADLAGAVIGRPADDDARTELDELRRRALDHDGDLEDGDVRRAMQLADRIVNAPTSS